MQAAGVLFCLTSVPSEPATWQYDFSFAAYSFFPEKITVENVSQISVLKFNNFIQAKHLDLLSSKIYTKYGAKNLLQHYMCQNCGIGKYLRDPALAVILRPVFADLPRSSPFAGSLAMLSATTTHTCPGSSFVGFLFF